MEKGSWERASSGFASKGCGMGDETTIGASDPESAASTDTANIHMRILGEECRFAVQVPLGRRRPVELLPSVREFTHQATAIAVRQARGQGKATSCKAHCGACCRQLVAISTVEAQALAEVIEVMPQERQWTIRERFAAGVLRLENAGLLDPQARRGDRGLMASSDGSRKALIHEISRLYFELQIACPFLEEESCGIHPDRPLVCREYHVTSPAELCRELYQARIEKVEPPLHMGDVLTAAASRFAGTKARTLPLILALEWAAAQSANRDQTFDGLRMFKELLDEIDRENQRSFDERG